MIFLTVGTGGSLTLGSASTSGVVDYLSTAVVNGQGGGNTQIVSAIAGSPQFKNLAGH
jgi:hypothetical protein